MVFKDGLPKTLAPAMIDYTNFGGEGDALIYEFCNSRDFAELIEKYEENKKDLGSEGTILGVYKADAK